MNVEATLGPALAGLFESEVVVDRATRVAGGASKESWSIDATVEGMPRKLFVRRAGGGVIYSETLSLETEYRLFCIAHDAGVPIPRCHGYIADLAGREAFVMDRVEGESIGRRLIHRPEFAHARGLLCDQMADALARIHQMAPGAVPPLPTHGDIAVPVVMRTIDNLEHRLDALDEPHPAIELGLAWLRANSPRDTDQEPVLVHGDFRVGNLMVGPRGLVAVLDWEFAHWGLPAEDLSWPLVRAWRFGADDLRMGGIGPVEPFLERYNTLTGRAIGLDELRFWEIAGNVRWAIGSLNQARRHLTGQERNVELAVLGRLAAEVEYEILALIEGDVHAEPA